MFDGESYLVTMSREQEMPNFKLLHLKLLTGVQKQRTSVTVSTTSTPKKSDTLLSTKSPSIKQSPISKQQPPPLTSSLKLQSPANLKPTPKTKR